MTRVAPLAGLVLAAALWGGATCVTKYALAGFGPLTLLGTALVMAAVVLRVAVLVRGRAAPPVWRLALPLGLLEPALAYVLDTVGIERTSAANASVLTGLESAFVVLLAAVFLRERITRLLGLALLGGLAGLLALERVGWFTGPGTGDLFVLGGALSAALYTIVARGMGEEADPLGLTADQFTVAALAVLPVTAVAWSTGGEPLPTDVPARFWVAAAALGVVGFAASFLLYNAAIRTVRASTAAVVLNLIPVFGLVGAVGWLGDALTGPRLIGGALIAASVAVFAAVEVRSEAAAPAPSPVATADLAPT